MTQIIAYSTESHIDPSEFADLLRRSTLGQRRPVDDGDVMRAMVENASLLISARTAGLLVGVARTLTDFAYCAYLSDLAVDKAYQRRGIGRQLVRLTRQACGPQTTLILLAAPQARDYYPHIGFDRHDSCWVLK